MLTVTPGATPADNLMRIDTAIRNNPGQEIRLDGTFAFGPTGSVTINTPITIRAGVNGAIIEGGKIPFLIDAAGKAVTIDGIRFAKPTQFAIQVKAVNTLVIRMCRIEGPIILIQQTINQNPFPSATFNTGGGIAVGGGPNTIGDLTVSENEIINIGGGSSDRSFGVMFNTVGTSTAKANIRLTGNKVTNFTAHGIDLREITGTALVENNNIDLGTIGGQPADLLDKFVDGIRCVGIGGYTVRGNTVKCDYANSAGIRLQGNSTTAPITGAIVSNNPISMSTQGNTPGSESAGVEIRRNCGSNAVSNNTISGDARTAVSLVAEPFPLDTTHTWLLPTRNGLTDNTLDGFSPTLADIFVGEGADSTFISNFFDFTETKFQKTGRTVTIIDEGTNTRMRGFYQILRQGSLM